MKLAEAKERVHAEDVGKWDLLLERDELRLCDGRIRFSRRHRPVPASGLTLTPWATSQLCQKLHIPSAYFRRCPPLLQDQQANYWLDQETTVAAGKEKGGGNERWLLRGKDETLRGLLSERYTRFNNGDVVQALEPLWAERFEVQWLSLTEESFHLRIIDPALSRDVLPGDRVMAGLHLANSEVGRRSVTLDALVFRLVCTNGLVRLVKGKSLFQKRHLALTPARFGTELQAALSEALIQATGFMERLTWATREPVADMERLLEAFRVRWGFSETLTQSIAKALSDERSSQQETVYGVINAMTGVARALAPEARYTLEVLAGRLLEEGLTGAGGLRLPALPSRLVTTDTDATSGEAGIGALVLF